MAARELTWRDHGQHVITPLISVNIPCYHQLEQARRCVESVLAQTLGDFEITLLDDGASDEYREYVASLRDARVIYHRNPERLGAMRNMFHAITAGRGTYSMAFHEDDLLGSRYLATAVRFLEDHPGCGFVGAQLRQFEVEPSADVLATPAEPPDIVPFASGADFLRAIFEGVELMFGSVVYRRSAVTGLRAAHDEFATLVDRPFLLAILAKWTGAVIRDPLVWYRKHGDVDHRHLAMSAEHILRMFAQYRSAFPERLSAKDEALFYDYTGYWLFTLYYLVPPEARPALRPFVFRAWREGLYNPRWSRGYGRKRLITLMLTGR
jgi:glycosyltransferase involved in cell wall biosynthesis